jgi:hypothetical protein
MISRRRLLLGSAAGAVVVAGGGFAGLLILDGYSSWIRLILQRALPGYELEPEGLDQFVAAYHARKKWKSKRMRAYAAIEHVIDINWALPTDMAEDVEDEERRIVSEFLLGSDFFQNYPDGAKIVTYAGLPEACVSPFATF